MRDGVYLPEWATVRPWQHKVSMGDESCGACSGSGYVLEEGVGFSVCSECQRRLGAGELIRMACLPRVLAEATVNGYVARNREQQAGKQLVADWVRAWAPGTGAGFEPGLFFWGPAGTGKSHLSAAAVRALANVRSQEWIDRDPKEWVWCGWAGVSWLLGIARLGAAGKLAAADDVLEAAETVPVLVLDDLGADRVTEFATGVLVDLLDQRLANGRPVIATANGSLEDLAEVIDGRIVSRLRELCVPVHLPGADYRGARHGGIGQRWADRAAASSVGVEEVA